MMETDETQPLHSKRSNDASMALKDEQHLQVDYGSASVPSSAVTFAAIHGVSTATSGGGTSTPVTSNSFRRSNSGNASLTATPTPPATTTTTTPSSTSATVTPSTATSTASASGVTAYQRGRTYRISTNGGATNKWVTREIAALDFLLNIPMEAEQNIVHHGWVMQQQQDDFYQQRGANVVPRFMTPAGTAGGNQQGNQNDYGDEAKRPEDEAVLEPPTSSQGGRWWEKLVGDSLTSNNRRGTTKDGGDVAANGSVLATAMSSDGLGEQQQQGDYDPLQPPPKISVSKSNDLDQKSLPPPPPLTSATNFVNPKANPAKEDLQVVQLSVPSRRLDGDDAILVKIPVKVDTMTRQKYIARQAAIREWERSLVDGYQQQQQQPPILDGRMFFSASGSYPLGVFSVLRYEPRKEEEARVRQKLEARGGGGTQFAVPERDWRGTTYRTLLPRVTKNHTSFHRFLRAKKDIHKNKNNNKGDNADSDDEDDDDDDDSVSSASSSDVSDTYVPGFLDDPEMVQGRHRNLMIGDRNTGCIIVSTIQFVEPALLKADLNKQFRERFESWEPPKSQRKYIGARVIDGVYTLMETEEQSHSDAGGGGGSGGGGTSGGDRSSRRTRQSSVTHTGVGAGSLFEEKDSFRMPPSLTLSKIRSVKQQALLAAVKAKLEISTVALACIYFERLCLDCRVDKTNRRLCFASCLLLSMKINEAYVGLVTPESPDETNNGKRSGLHSLIRTTNKSQSMFASLLEFFTQDWQLSLKQLFAAEWGVFAALGFSLHVKPSHVAFHFKRLMKTLEWNVLPYLGREMYNQWQDELEDEESRRRSRERRREIRRKRKEKNLLALQRELQVEADRREKRLSELHNSGWKLTDDDDHNNNNSSPQEEAFSPLQEPATPAATLTSPLMDKLSSTSHHRNGGRMKIFNRLSMKKSVSQGKLHNSSHEPPQQQQQLPIPFVEIASRRKRLSLSPSMPLFTTTPPQPQTPPQRRSSNNHMSIDVNHHGEESDLMSEDGSDAGIIV